MGGISYEKASKQIPAAIDLVRGGSERIKNIVKELKDYARKETEKQSFVEVNLNDVVESAVTLLANLIKKSTSRFATSLFPELPPIKGNYQRLEQVVINLIANSCQALESAGDEIRIETNYSKSDDRVILKVIDNGRGMSEETIKHVFDPFFTTKRDDGGSGLGMAISSKIIKEHRGRIWFESEEDKGALAIVELPTSIKECE